ncbi:hypothetical protein I5R65_00475 [Herbaspirillum sp. AP02]|uniref:hypothetical protein n=1 Tax=unclassified Herbaspirillum TaxID=2624150 RepID=UPI0015DB901B|nr:MULTISPECIES: hypothetical protein [unclassified Herbaspirillum]MBG7617926.1 hypothetical protein [Herbaspirillum sp. AP02]NZD70113.1 hypothetical protein [Herbaspirillum sp. AP21]
MTTNRPPGRWRRLIETLSGPPNEAVLATRRGKPFWRRYPQFSWGMIISLVLFIAPEFVNQWNRVPDPSTLQTLQVRILHTQLTEPHLFVELPNGERRQMEWPVDISAGGRFRTHVWTDAQRKSLPGCMATVQGAPLKLTLTDRFRIWALDCPEQHISITFHATSKSQPNRLTASLVIWLIFLIPYYLFYVFIFLREKRGQL